MMLPSCQQIKPGTEHTVTAHFPVNSDSCKVATFFFYFWQPLGVLSFPERKNFLRAHQELLAFSVYSLPRGMLRVLNTFLVC